MPYPGVGLFPGPGLYPGEDLEDFTAGVLASVEPWLDTDLQNYITALASVYEPVFQLVVDQGDPDTNDYIPGWSQLLDPDNCPTQFLPYLAQFNGTIVPPGTPDTAARSIIKAEAGFSRGTTASIIAAAARNLTGTQSVTLIERLAADGSTLDAYHFVLIVRPEEVTSVAALTAAVNATKPAGIQWTLVQTDSYTWASAINTWSADTFSWNSSANTQP